MSDRGIKKWAPYKSLDAQDFTLKEHKEKEEKIEKPTISSESAEEINNILVNYNGETLEFGYFKNGKILYVVDKIKTINTFERKIILFSKKIIMLNDLVSVSIKEGEEIL